MLKPLQALGVFSLLSLAISAQSTADYSGRWVAVSPASAAGRVLVITQDTSTIKLEPGGVVAGFSPVYRLNGKPAGANTEDGQRINSSASWREGRLLLIDAPLDPAILRHERILSLDPKGRLILERLKPRQAPDQESIIQSERILDSQHIVFEKR